MPCYTYICEKCSHKFEIVCSIREYKDVVKCENCKKNATRSYEDDLSTLSTSIRLANSEIKTLGHLANRNSESMSNDQKIELYNKHNSYKEEESKKTLPQGMSRISKPKGKIKWTKE